MQLTKHTDLSLRVLMYLALKPDELVTISEIAEQYHNESRNHLVKVVHKLSTLGYIESTRGRNGGLRLNQSESEIGIGVVVREMEFNLNVIDCSGMQCPLLPSCRLKSVLNEASNAFMNVLDEYTLTDLVKNRKKLLQLVG